VLDCNIGMSYYLLISRQSSLCHLHMPRRSPDRQAQITFTLQRVIRYGCPERATRLSFTILTCSSPVSDIPRVAACMVFCTFPPNNLNLYFIHRLLIHGLYHGAFHSFARASCAPRGLQSRHVHSQSRFGSPTHPHRRHTSTPGETQALRKDQAERRPEVSP